MVDRNPKTGVVAQEKAPTQGSLVQRELSATRLTEGLSGLHCKTNEPRNAGDRRCVVLLLFFPQEQTHHACKTGMACAKNLPPAGFLSAAGFPLFPAKPGIHPFLRSFAGSPAYKRFLQGNLAAGGIYARLSSSAKQEIRSEATSSAEQTHSAVKFFRFLFFKKGS